MFALGPCLSAAQEVAFGQHTDQFAVFVDHRQSTDVALKHQPGGLQYGRIRSDRNDVARHHIFGFHGGPPIYKDHEIRSPSEAP